MPESPFPILGTTVPPLLGRTAILQRMLNALTKAAPDHLQVVGPRFAGKTVLLHGLAERLRQRAGAPFSAVFIWDLGHQTPATDQQFMQRLAQEIGAALRDRHPEYAEHLRAASDGAYQDIGEVLDLLGEEGTKVLAIMDGFDKPMAQGGLTRNLWDQLRELALKPSLRLVTASRRTLSELIRHPDAQTSDFWNIFNATPVRVGCFDDADLEAVLASLSDVRFEAGAKTELLNETNGFPILMLSVLNTICHDGTTGLVAPQAMRTACDDSFDSLRDTLATLWRDCAVSSQDLLRRVMDASSVPRTGIVATDADALVERGFVHQSGNRLERPCRLIRRYLDEQPHEGNALARLFSSAEAYSLNLAGVLDRRIQQIDDMDSTLKRYLLRGVEDMPSHPDVFLSNVHGVLERALTLIWQAECWDTVTGLPRIPSDWFLVWASNGDRMEDWRTRFPEGGQRLRLLDLMTGTQRQDRLARHVTKNTYTLANAVQGFRDFGTHPKTTRIDEATGYVALHTCIELAAALVRELPPAVG